MECQICGQGSNRRSKVFIDGSRLFACRQCVLKLRTHDVFYCEACRQYHFDRKWPLEGTNGREPVFSGY